MEQPPRQAIEATLQEAAEDAIIEATSRRCRDVSSRGRMVAQRHRRFVAYPRNLETYGNFAIATYGALHQEWLLDRETRSS